MSRGLASWLRLGALGLIWGSVFLWIKVANYGVSPVQMVLARLVLGAVVLVAIGRLRGLRLPSGRTVWRHLLVAAALGNAIPWVLFAYGERSAPSSIAGVINSTTPLWTTLAVLAWQQEKRLGWWRAASLLFGISGTVLIAAPWQATNVDAGAVVMFVVGTLSLGVSFAYMGRYLVGRGIPPLMLAAGQLLAASALLLVATPFAGLQPIDTRLDAMASILVLGVMCTGIAYVINFRLITDEGAATASTATYLFPVVAVLLGALVLDEPIGWTVVAGMVLTLAGVALAHRRPVRPTPAPTVTTPAMGTPDAEPAGAGATTREPDRVASDA